MKKVYSLLMVCSMLVLTACGETGVVSEENSTVSLETPAPESGDGKVVWWEKKENLGLKEESSIRLESDEDNSDLKMMIDQCVVDLSQESLQHNNYNFTKILKKDWDGDGVMEVFLLFYGGSGGTFQNFRLIKSDGQQWRVVPMDWDGEEGFYVDVKALKNSSVQINIEDTGYEKTVQVSGNDYLKKEGEKATVGSGYRFFELLDDGVVVAYRLYADNVGDGFGDLRQKIQLNEDSTRLVPGETNYMPIKEAEKRAYELAYEFY